MHSESILRGTREEAERKPRGNGEEPESISRGKVNKLKFSSLSYKKDSRMSEDYFTMKLFLHLKIGTLDQAKTFVPRQDLQILNRIFNAE